MPLLAAVGLPLRTRLAAVLLLIGAYVPLAGGGASIRRAGVMGAAGVLAAMAGRPASRWHAVLLAALVTLAVDPRAADWLAAMADTRATWKRAWFGRAPVRDEAALERVVIDRDGVGFNAERLVA